MSRTRKPRSGAAAKQRIISRIPIIVIGVLVMIVAIRYCEARNRTAAVCPPPSDATELLEVVTAPGLPQEKIDYYGFTVSFNPKLHIPNWVAWELTRDEVKGPEPRGNNFAEDSEVRGCALPSDYKNSGYDRGHMCPAGDMKWSPEAMNDAFLMTNMCPQAHSLNSGSWKSLEEKCRQWAAIDSAIIIITGPVLSQEPVEYIGASQVAVPSAFFKVILSPYANPARGIAFIMPNGKVPGGMQQAAVSIDEVERITGHDFFSALPDDIENAVEAQCNFHQWSTLKPSGR